MVEILQGEEITICYTDSDKALWSREERRADLKSVYNFDCNCKGCDMTELKIQQESENIAAFKEQVAEKERVETTKRVADNNHELQLNLIREELDCVKQMYKLSKKIKSMNRGWILDNVVEQGFNVSCSGAQGEFDLAGLLDNRTDQKKVWTDDAKKFANVGLQIGKTLFGADNSRTQLWEERGANPIKFYFNSLAWLDT